MFNKFCDRYDHDKAFRDKVNTIIVDIIFLICGIASFGIPVLIIENILNHWK